MSKAVENGIVAIGITDYSSIDGYKRIKEAYLSNPEKMAELFPNEELRDAIERMGKKSNTINTEKIYAKKGTNTFL